MAKNATILRTTAQFFSARFARRLLVAPILRLYLSGEGLVGLTALRNF